MILYLSIAALLFCVAFLRLIGTFDRRHESTFVLMLVVLVWAFSWLRWQVGTDWDIYFDMYGAMTSVGAAREQSWWGPGYAYLAVFTNSFGGSYTVFLILISTIIFATNFYLLRKSTAAPLVALFALFCMNFFDLFFVRESVAVAFFWLFVFCYFHKRYLVATLACIAAISFHSGSILPISVVLAASHLSWQRMLLAGAAVAILGYLVLRFISLDQIIKLLPLLEYYLTSDFVEEKSSALSTTVRAYVKLGFWLFFVGLNWKLFVGNRSNSGFEDVEWTGFCLKMGAAIIAASAILLPLSEAIARIPAYAMPLFAVVLSNRNFRFRNISLSDFGYLLCCLMLFVQLGFLYSSYAQLYYPFKTILAQ